MFLRVGHFYIARFWWWVTKLILAAVGVSLFFTHFRRWDTFLSAKKVCLPLKVGHFFLLVSEGGTLSLKYEFILLSQGGSLFFTSFSWWDTSSEMGVCFFLKVGHFFLLASEGGTL